MGIQNLEDCDKMQIKQIIDLNHKFQAIFPIRCYKSLSPGIKVKDSSFTFSS